MLRKRNRDDEEPRRRNRDDRLELLELTEEGNIREALEMAANGGEGMFSPCIC